MINPKARDFLITVFERALPRLRFSRRARAGIALLANPRCSCVPVQITPAAAMASLGGHPSIRPELK